MSSEFVFGLLADTQADGRWRLAQHDAALAAIAAEGARRGVRLWLHGGDVYEHPSGSTAEERYSVHRGLIALASRAPVVIAGGNHEAAGEVEELTRLDTEWRIHAIEDGPAAPFVECPANITVRVAVCPWPRKSKLLRWLPDGTDAEVRKAAGREALRAVYAGLGQKLRETSLPRLALAHAQVVGAISDADQPLVGHDFEVAVEDLALMDADFTGLGHIHKPQHWTYGGRDFVFPGSPTWTRFASGETVPKGWVLGTWHPDRTVTWERIEIPGQRLLLIDAAWENGKLVFAGSYTPAGARVLPPHGSAIRLRYSVPAPDRAAARADADGWARAWTEDHGCEVVVEERIEPQVLARAPEIATAPTVEEKLRLFLARTNPQTPERTERLVERLRGLAEAR